jgi:hypothetical protein
MEDDENGGIHGMVEVKNEQARKLSFQIIVFRPLLHCSPEGIYPRFRTIYCRE